VWIATQTGCNLRYSTFIFGAGILQNVPFKTQSNQQSWKIVWEIHHIVAYLFKARIVEPEETSIAREQQVTTCDLVLSLRSASHSHGNRDARNNRGTLGKGVLCAVTPEAT
jgi:hypothetical protein